LLAGASTLSTAQPEFVKLSKEIDKRSSELGKEFEPGSML
jgi:hypothetical protein